MSQTIDPPGPQVEPGDRRFPGGVLRVARYRLLRHQLQLDQRSRSRARRDVRARWSPLFLIARVLRKDLRFGAGFDLAKS